MDRKRLDRLLRVRTLQLGLTQAGEVVARTRVEAEAALQHRIAGLVAAVSPAPSTDGAMAFAAAAHFRERLHHTADAADARVRNAQAQLDRAAEATRAARRDQSAIEKLLAQAEKDAALRAIRALEAAPPTRKVRHDPC